MPQPLFGVGQQVEGLGACLVRKFSCERTEMPRETPSEDAAERGRTRRRGHGVLRCRALVQPGVAGAG